YSLKDNAVGVVISVPAQDLSADVLKSYTLNLYDTTVSNDPTPVASTTEGAGLLNLDLLQLVGNGNDGKVFLYIDGRTADDVKFNTVELVQNAGLVSVATKTNAYYACVGPADELPTQAAGSNP